MMVDSAWKAMADYCAVMTLSDEEFLEQQWNIINEESAIRLWLFLQMITGHDHTAKNIFYVAKYNEESARGYEFYYAPWDMDLTWGNVSVGEVNSVYTAFEKETVHNRVYWETGDRLVQLNYAGSRERMQALYQELRDTVLSDEAVGKIISSLDHQVRDSGAFSRDRERWTDSVHAENCNQLLEYAKERLEFLDQALFDAKYLEVK